MVAWDLGFDPTALDDQSFLDLGARRWLLRGASTNFLGWFFTVYVFFHLFMLFLRLRRTDSKEEASTFPGSYYAQAIIMYAVTGLAFVVAYLSGSRAGHWHDGGGLAYQKHC